MPYLQASNNHNHKKILGIYAQDVKPDKPDKPGTRGRMKFFSLNPDFTLSPSILYSPNSWMFAGTFLGQKMQKKFGAAMTIKMSDKEGIDAACVFDLSSIKPNKVPSIRKDLKNLTCISGLKIFFRLGLNPITKPGPEEKKKALFDAVDHQLTLFKNALSFSFSQGLNVFLVSDLTAIDLNINVISHKSLSQSLLPKWENALSDFPYFSLLHETSVLQPYFLETTYPFAGWIIEKGAKEAENTWINTAEFAYSLQTTENKFRESQDSFKNILEALRETCTLKEVTLDYMPPEARAILVKHPIINDLYLKCSARHKKDPSGHDAVHVKEVFTRSLYFAAMLEEKGIKVDKRALAICALTHDLGYTIKGIGRKKHASPEAAEKVVELLEAWDQEFKERYAPKDLFSHEEIELVKLCVAQHSLKDDPSQIAGILGLISNSIVRIVTLADKSRGSGLPGACRCIQFGVNEGRTILAYEDDPPDKPSSESYMEQTLIGYIEKLAHWSEYRAVKAFIQKQTSDMEIFIQTLKREELFPPGVKNTAGTKTLKRLDALSKLMEKRLGPRKSDALMHPKRVAILALQIACRYHLGRQLGEEDYYNLAAAALLHNFYKPGHGLVDSKNEGVEVLVDILLEAQTNEKDIATIIRLIDEKQLGATEVRKSILVPPCGKITPILDLAKELKISGDTLEVKILTSAEILAKNYGAHGIVHNILKAGQDKTDLATTFFRFIMKMYDNLAKITTPSLTAAKELALPLADFNRDFVLSYLAEVTETNNPIEALRVIKEYSQQ